MSLEGLLGYVSYGGGVNIESLRPAALSGSDWRAE